MIKWVLVTDAVLLWFIYAIWGMKNVGNVVLKLLFLAAAVVTTLAALYCFGWAVRF